MNLNFKPMLACSTMPELEDIKYPVLASPKLDGIRCVIGDGVAFSRTMKRIPNKHISKTLQELRLHGLDGELMVDGDFNDVQSVVMSEYHFAQDRFYYAVFDSFLTPKEPFEKRAAQAESIVKMLLGNKVRLVPQHLVTTPEQMQMFFDTCIHAGYEGAIVRDPKAPYKNGRSTLNQGWMLKLKRFYDSEAIVIEAEELMHNEDTSTKQKANLYGGNTLGALVVRWKNKQFKIGTGFDNEERSRLWAMHQRGDLVNQHITFKYQEVSKYGIPRFPVYKGVRYDHK